MLKNLGDFVVGVVMIAIGLFIGVFWLSLIMGLPVMWLWNWLIPDIFHGPTITYLQAVGLFILTGILIRASVDDETNKSTKE